MNRSTEHGLRTGLMLLCLLAVWMPVRGAGLLIADGGFGGVLEIEKQQVDVTINNGIAVTEVTQVFRNTENRQVEALYTFPVPKGASISNFSMWINGTEMIGEVLEKQRAREIYDSYKRKRQDPGLLEQVDYKTFEMRIFPIAPRAEQRVKLTYSQELELDNDWATYVYPLATTAQEAKGTTAGEFSFNLQFKSLIPIVQAKSPSHAQELVAVQHTPNLAQFSLEGNNVSLNRDIVIAAQLKRPVSGADLVTSKRGREDGYFCLTLTAGEDLAKLNTGMDYVFILDVSGSMSQDGKLGLSTDAVGAFVETLGEDDRFEVITFNVQPKTLFGDLRAPTDDSRQVARTFLSSAEARGGTVLKSALDTAYRYSRPDVQLNVVILSDGLTEQGERRQLVDLIKRRPAATRVFCIGVGNDVNRPLLEQLAQDAGGLASFISRGDNFERQAQAFRRKLMRPAIECPTLEISGVKVYDLEPAIMPNVFHGSPVRVYGRYSGSGTGDVTITGNVNGRLIETNAALEFPASNESNPELERMWAWRRVDRLLKEADGAGNRQAVVDEIVRLGEGYSIATEYTSFLVLENNAEFQRWKIARNNALRVDRDRQARQVLQAQLDSLRDQAAQVLGPDPKAETQAPVVADNRQPQNVQAQPQQPVRAPAQTSNNRQSMSFGHGFGSGPIGPLFMLIIGGLSFLGRRRHAHRVG